MAEAVGLPSWTDVVIDVVSESDPRSREALKDEIEPGREAAAVEIVAARIGRDELVTRLREAFRQRPKEDASVSRRC